MKDRFYLACFRDNVGSNVAWHAKDGRGYVTDINKAHQYNLKEAQHAWDMAREYDQPISADHVDDLAVWKVDCQYIPTENQINGSELYVAFAKNRWDGNDVYWLSDGHLTTNFRLAKTFKNHRSIPSSYVVIPFEVADKVKRRTFDYSMLNKRIMVQGAGLITPQHIIKSKRLRNSGKTRFNCPECGKISWQYNPYDFEGCKDPYCSAWESPYYD